MSLTAGINIAKSALTTVSAQTAVVSRNISGANEAGYVRRSAYAVTSPGGGIQLPSITRDQNQVMFDRLLGVSSTQAGTAALTEGLDRLEAIYEDPQFGRSPSALIGELNDALQIYAGSPHNTALAGTVVTRAVSVADALNSASDTVQQIRSMADAGMDQSVERINTLLAQFENVNTEIIASQPGDPGRNEFLDTRDRLLNQLSEEIGIKTVTRADDDIVIYTDSGVTLFEKIPRSVTFQPTMIYQPSTQGSAVLVDGVSVTGSNSAMPLNTGRLVGLSELRDGVSNKVQDHLDEVARGLIEIFAEADQNVPASLPNAAGLFTYSGAPAVPVTGTLIAGLANDIRINASVDPAQGGNAQLLRDGGIADLGNPAYVYNQTGEAGYSERLRELGAQLNSQRSFDPTTGLPPTVTVGEFSASAAGWLAETRSTAQAETDYQTALKVRVSLSLSNKTGVNVDEEMTHLLDLERSYQASARLLSAVDNMYASLFNAVG